MEICKSTMYSEEGSKYLVESSIENTIQSGDPTYMTVHIYCINLLSQSSAKVEIRHSVFARNYTDGGNYVCRWVLTDRKDFIMGNHTAVLEGKPFAQKRL